MTKSYPLYPCNKIINSLPAKMESMLVNPPMGKRVSLLLRRQTQAWATSGVNSAANVELTTASAVSVKSVYFHRCILYKFKIVIN